MSREPTKTGAPPGQHKRSCDIFISHSVVDKPLAELLKAELERRLSCPPPGGGVRCFCSSDPTDLPPGSAWADEIQGALRSTAIVLVVVSPASLARTWVWFEVGACWFKEGVSIIPLCFGGQEPAKLPLPLSARQATDGRDFAGLLHAVARTLGCRASDSDAEAVSRLLGSQDLELAVDRREAVVVLPLLQPGESVTVFPDRPLDAQEGGFSLAEVRGEWVKLCKAASPQLVPIPRNGIERVERVGDGTPARIVLKGRLQWLTLLRQWRYFPEPPVDDYGLPRVFSLGAGKNPDLDALVQQAMCQGVGTGWAPLSRAHTRRGLPGEVVYFGGGRYARATQGQVLVRL
ncbi:MAG: toll/interleukin-1 receptor domain-containing protein [Terriglobales bacterium]